MRLAGFDALFRSAVRQVQRPEPALLVLLLDDVRGTVAGQRVLRAVEGRPRDVVRASQRAVPLTCRAGRQLSRRP